MSISTLPLSYCTNVHPGLTVAQVVDGLTDCTARVRQSLAAPVAAGLWFARPVITEIMESTGKRAQIKEKHATGHYSVLCLKR